MNRPSAVTALLTKRYNLNQSLKHGAEAIADYIIELEEEVQHLQRNNQTLSKRAEDVERLARLIEIAHGDEAYFEVFVDETMLEMERMGGAAKMTASFYIDPTQDLYRHAPIVRERYVMRLSRLEKRKRQEAKG